MYKKGDVFYHIGLKEGDVGRYVLLPGDPFRTDIIAQSLDNPRLVAHQREHKTWTGTLNGEKVSVTSTGMGCPSTAIAVEELIAAGADTFIRVGTADRVAAPAHDGGVSGTIVTAAIRDEGTTTQYLPIEYPAVADRRVVQALAEAADKLGYRFLEGITHSKDSFYTQVFPDAVPAGELWQARQKIWQRANVMCSEMESAAIFVISSIRGCRASGVMAFSDAPDQAAEVAKAIDTACEAIKILIAMDKQCGK
ncbi:nucleoside phosphorylase [Serratia rubidaea]|uniref:Uridine phosphorylase n=1 Tax=Serratia rubidaea TaxID=61652 RepID=A0A3S4WNA9_SERRU|nr:nucleoside phosphorylase [Serratia rubidaea]VEI61520.1 Uridine phosphorylase [Serratia rubidaea]